MKESSGRFDVIVVGSGFGGSVCAARLAERGFRVLILERGPWWGPANQDRPKRDRREFPRGLFGLRKLIRNVRTARNGRRRERLFNADGLLEGHRFDHLNSVTASGVGGGSHVYTNILEEPPPAFFDAYPAEITGEELHPYFDRVREMLRPEPMPTASPKSQVFAAAVERAGMPRVELPDLAIEWGRDAGVGEPVPNAAGVEQRPFGGDVDVFVGCEDRSKTTLDLTYVPLALRHGAELRPLCEVLTVGGDDNGYRVRYVDHRSGKIRRESAPRLVLAAGGLNTQRLLFDARDGHRSLPKLPKTLGQHFSPNADFAALLWRTLLRDSSKGPSVGAITRVTDESSGALRFVLGELGLPVQALPLPGPLRKPLEQSTLLFGMGRDASGGTVEFDGTGLVTSIGRSFDPGIYDEMTDAIARIAPHYEPRRVIYDFLSGAGDDGIFTVHPLGGCSIGRGPDDGFTDHRGQVWVHPGLFVADGSLYPRSPGTAPSMTIAALAERQAALIT